ncbi:MAG TPA: hypothetical protein VGH95_02735 [Candidatus Aquirickettsiella sp.]|jgi:hypothetical protein
MLDEYQMDPAFNKNLVFAYQPPPIIEVSTLPTLAKNWLDDLQKIACTTNDKLPNNCFAKHLGETSEYRAKIILLEQLQLIYHRLIGNLDTELGELSADHRHGLIYKLTEEIKECTEGFHNRVNIIADSFHKPRDLTELLYIVRNRLVQEIATQLTDEVHAWNGVGVIAAIDGLGIKPNFPNDTYTGSLSETTIRRALQQTFAKKFTPFNLPCFLIAAFIEFIPELEIEKNDENGICLQTQQKITRLIKRFLPKYINEKPEDANNWKNYFKISRNEKNPLVFSFVNVNWEKMYQSFYQALSDQNYVKKPQINTLLDSAYRNLFIEKKQFRAPTEVISKLFKEEDYSDLLTQLVELKTRFPNYYQKITKNKVFINNCLPFIDYLTRQLKISKEYSEEIMQGFHLVIGLDLRRKNFIIEKIADTFLVKNQNGFNLLMLGALNNLDLVKDILAFLKTHETIVNSEIAEKMLLMKNSDHCNALMIAANKQAEAIITILSFLTTHIGRFANDTVRKLFTQQQKKDSNTAVTLTARNHPDMLNKVLTFISDNMTIDGEILHKVLFPEQANGTCNALMLALKNQADTAVSILKFISENIKSFDPEILRKMFLEKDENGFTILMLAVRYHPNVLPILLKLLNARKIFFPAEYLTALFFEKNLLNYNFLMLAAEYQPKSVSIILQFIQNKQKIFNPYLEEILFNKNQKGCNSLMLSRHHPEAMTSIIDFIYQQPKGVLSLSLEEIFLQKNNLGLTFFMLLAKDKPQSLKLVLEFIEKHPDLFTKENLFRLILEKSEQEYNSFMLAARNQYDAVAHILNFIQKNPKIFSPAFLNELILAHDQNRCNALMIAATYRPKVVELLLVFLAFNIAPKGPISTDSIQEFVFKKIHDKQAANGIFFGGRYDCYKSVLSVTSQLEDQIPINALLKFTDDHIELLGIQIFIDLLKEQDAQGNYIFRSACARNPFLMKNTLNFLANSVNNEDLMSAQNLAAYFIFEQFACWSIKTVADQALLDKIIENCSVPLLIYFDKDYFAEKPNNLKIVTDKLFRCYLNELEDLKIKKITYTTQFSFFKWRYSTAQKLEAAQALEKVLDTKDFVAGVDLFQLKHKYPALTGARLSNLFAAYQQIDLLEAEGVVESNLENDAICSKMLAAIA